MGRNANALVADLFAADELLADLGEAHASRRIG
jgi:hypothetical protein